MGLPGMPPSACRAGRRPGGGMCDEIVETCLALRAQRTQASSRPPDGATCSRTSRSAAGGRGVPGQAIRQGGPVAFEILVEAGLKKLFCMGEAIKIKVIYAYSRIFVRFDQGIRRALDPAGEAQAAAGRGSGWSCRRPGRPQEDRQAWGSAAASRAPAASVASSSGRCSRADGPLSFRG